MALATPISPGKFPTCRRVLLLHPQRLVRTRVSPLRGRAPSDSLLQRHRPVPGPAATEVAASGERRRGALFHVPCDHCRHLLEAHVRLRSAVRELLSVDALVIPPRKLDSGPDYFLAGL